MMYRTAVILFWSILQGIAILRIYEQCLKSVVEPHLVGKLSRQGVEAQTYSCNISITWPARSPDLTPSDFLLWMFLTDQDHWTPVRDLTDFQEIIYAAVNIVTPRMLHNTWVEVEYQLKISRASNGSHVEVYGPYSRKRIPVFTLCSNWFHL